MANELGIVTLGTSSPLKRAAVEAVLGNRAGVVINVIDDFISPIPPQPVGLEQTESGAYLRARAAQTRALATRSAPDVPALSVGIENGMHADATRGWVDLAAVVVILNSDGAEQRWTGWSDAVDIPADSIARMQSSPDGWNHEHQRPTGSVTWSDLKDPHSIINPLRPRAVFLQETLTNLLDAHRDQLPAVFRH